MNRRYTREQILESLKFWRNELRKLDESSSLIIDALCSKFGENVVRSTNRNVILDTKLCYSILDVLNPILFNNRLKHIPIKCMPFADIVDDCKNNDKQHAVYDYEYNIKDFLGLFTTYIVTEDSSVTTLSFDDKLVARDQMIYINYDKVYRTSFIFAASTLCHELIHYYDSLVGEYVEVKRLVAMGKINKEDEMIAEHSTKTFLERLSEANEQKLNVISSGEGKLIKVLDQEAIEKMKEAFVEESEDPIELSPENSTDGVHIYTGRSFRTYSW